MPASQEVRDADGISFHCTAEGCTYSKRDARGIVLHMRTHFVYETAQEVMPKATFLFKDGIYQCLDCNRKTNNRISFREHVRHHILPLPYRCCRCGRPVASIPDLRKHSSVAHPKMPLQMYFEDSDGLLGEILCSIGPEKQTFWFPKRMMHVDSEKVQNLSDLSEESVSGDVVNKCMAKTNLATDVKSNDNLVSRLLVRKANAEAQQNENCFLVSPENGSGLGRGPSSTSASSILEFSAEYNYVNAFSCSRDTTVPDSNAFYVLNVPDDNLNETRTNCSKDFCQATVKSPEIWPVNQQNSPRLENMTNLQGFDSSVLMSPNTDSSCSARDISLSNAPNPLIMEYNRQTQAESDSELLTIFSRVMTSDSEVLPVSRVNTTINGLDFQSLDEPTPTSGPGKFVFRDGKFQCLTCLNWETVSGKVFRKHVWQHLHGVSGICKKTKCQAANCPLVSGLVMLVMNASNVQSVVPSELRSKTLHKNYPCSSTPMSRLSDLGKARNTSSLNGSDQENLCDVEPSLPTSENFAEQRENSTKKTEKKNNDGSLIENLSQRSAEQLRFSAPTLSSLRSKACRHLNFSRDLVGDFAGKDEDLQKDERHIDVSDHGQEISCVTKTALNCNEPDVSAPVSGEDTTSPNRRKQTLLLKQDVNQPVEYCRYSRDSIPLSTVCDLCSYTCNCRVQLTWHVESCHRKTVVKRKREFRCTECGFSDNSKQTLIWHMAHHIGQHTLKVFGCKYCSRQSTYMSRIMKHIYRFHSGKVMEVVRENNNIAYMDGIFKCPFCHSGYPWGSLFFRHIEVQHKLNQLADYLAHAYRRKCCPEVIEFPKYIIPNDIANKISKENTNDFNGSAMPGCTENENVSKIQQHSENTTDSIRSRQSKNDPETDDRSNDAHVSESRGLHNNSQKMTVESRNAGICSSAKGDLHSTNATSKDVQKSLIDAETLERCSKNQNSSTGSINQSKLLPCLGKTMQNDLIEYNSMKRRMNKFQSPKAFKRSFLISPSRVPTLPRNLENASASDFEKNLPNQFIFSQAIKCPKCYYTDRIRLNLIRHYNGHLTDASKGGELSEASNLQTNTGEGLTFALWNPKKSDKKVTESDKLVANKKKDNAIVLKQNDKEPLQKGSRKRWSGKRRRNVKRAKLTDRACKLDTGNDKEPRDSAETINRGSGTNTRDSTRGNDAQKSSTSFGSPPAFGQFLQNHARKVLATFSCESCSTTFSSETEYEKHAKAVHSSTSYICKCGNRILGLSNVLAHFKESHPQSPVIVVECSSPSRGSGKRIHPFSETSGVGLPSKKMKMANADEETRQSPDKLDTEKEDLPREQKWSSFYGAKFRKLPASSAGPNSTVRATNADFSMLNMISKVSSDSSSQMPCATVVSATCASTGGATVNAVSVPANESMTGMASHAVPGSCFPPLVGNNSVLATLMSKLLAASQTVPVTQVPAMQVPAMPAVGTQIPSTVEPAAPVMMAGQLPMSGIQPVVDTSAFTNLLASFLMANLAAGAGLGVPTSYSNGNAAIPRDTAYPFQPGANNLNLLGTSSNPQHMPSMAELIKEAINPSFGSNMYGIYPSASNVNVQNSISVAEVSKNLPTFSHTSALIPGASSVATRDSSDDNSRQSFGSLDSASKPVYTATSGSKRKQFSNPEYIYSSEAESTVSLASQTSKNSKSYRSNTTSKKSSKPCTDTQKRKKNRCLRDGFETHALDIERCSSRSSVSTTDLSHRELLFNNSSSMSVGEIFADCAIQMRCNRCTYKTKKLKHFEEHLTVHFENKQPTVDPKLWKPVRQRCGFCNFQTYLDEEFQEHIATHMIKKPYQCSYCSFAGFTKANINRHLIKLHSELEPKFEKNQNVRLKQTVLPKSATKVSLNPVVQLENILKLNITAVDRLCSKYSLVKLNLEEK